MTTAAVTVKTHTHKGGANCPLDGRGWGSPLTFDLREDSAVAASGKSHQPVQMESRHDFRRTEGAVNRNAFPMDLDITTFNPADSIRVHKFEGLSSVLNCTHFNGFTRGLLLVPSLGHTCLDYLG